MNHVKQPDHRLHLSALQAPDEVPGQIAPRTDRRELGERLLEPVLTQNPHASINRGTDPLHRDGLRHRDEANRIRLTSGALRRPSHALQDGSNVSGDGIRIECVRQTGPP
jgi:hypothetical protein